MYFCFVLPILKASMGRGGVDLHIGKRRFVRFGFDELESRKFIDKSRTKQQRTPHEVYYIRSHSLQSISRLLPRVLTIYLHWRGAFGVARFDLSGNARASIRESGDRRDSTLEPISVFYNANNQLKH